jgi:MFS family permease
LTYIKVHLIVCIQLCSTKLNSMDTNKSAIAYLLPVSLCVFFGYLTVGISLGTVPLFVHGVLHYNNFMVGLTIGIQSAATLAFRHYSGTLCDTKGSRFSVRYGVWMSVLAGLTYALASALTWAPGFSLLILCIGRIFLGIGESLMITGALAWGIGLVGHQRSGKVMAWVGIAIYGAVACGAPLGLWLMHSIGSAKAFLSIVILPWLGWFMVMRLPLVVAVGKARAPFYQVIKQVGLQGSGLALGTVGFGGLASFVALYFGQRGWGNASLALTVFGGAYILVRLFWAHLPDRLGGARVALFSLTIEILGQVLLWQAPSVTFALLGATLTGMGFSLVFPSFGVEAVRKVSPQSKGVALGAYMAFFDLSLGLTGPIAGWVAGQWGYAAVYAAGAISALAAFVLALGLNYKNAVKHGNYSTSKIHTGQSVPQ